MSGAKETPRQKMIGMMYLVLTALLALNVSVEVLDAFTIVNEGIENTYESVDKKIDDYYKTFEQQYDKNPEKAGDYWKKAQDIRKKTDEIINYIEKDIKYALLLMNSGLTEEELLNPETEEERLILNPEEIDLTKNRRIFHKVNFGDKALNQRDKHDNVTLFMIENGKASELRSKVDEYRNFIVNTVETAGVKGFGNNVALVTNGEYFEADGTPSTWERTHFYHVIIPGAISVINELVAEIQTTEYDAIAALFKSIGASDFKFNTLEAKVFPKTTYVLKGQDYEADVFIVASDDTREFTAKYAKGIKDFSKANSKAVQDVKSQKGIVKIKFPATAEGEQSFAGIIEMKNPVTGEIEPYPFNSSYTVAPPSANVTPTKMNVMYRELENPISVTAPGFTANQIEVKVANGELIKKDGQLFVVPGNDQTPITTVSVYANADGKKVLLQNTDFRLKKVPDPVPVVNGKSQGKFTKDEILAAGGFRLEMEDFDFEGYNFEVVSYKVSANIGGFSEGVSAKGRRFTDDVKKFISNVRPGQRVRIEEIVVKSPGGEERPLRTVISMDIK